jgi:hypothetical protein
MKGSRDWIILVTSTVWLAPSSIAGAQPTPATHPRVRRAAAVAVGVVAGGVAGLFIGRRAARASLCEGCVTSANHDGYIGAGLALGALSGGALAWYVTRPRREVASRVSSPSYLRTLHPTGDLRMLAWLALLNSPAGEFGRWADSKHR